MRVFETLFSTFVNYNFVAPSCSLGSYVLQSGGHKNTEKHEGHEEKVGTVRWEDGTANLFTEGMLFPHDFF